MKWVSLATPERSPATPRVERLGRSGGSGQRRRVGCDPAAGVLHDRRSAVSGPGVTQQGGNCRLLPAWGPAVLRRNNRIRAPCRRGRRVWYSPDVNLELFGRCLRQRAFWLLWLSL